MAQLATAPTASYTWQDFLELDEEDPRELVGGQLVEIDMPTLTHERIVAVLIAILGHWSSLTSSGQVIGSGYRIRIDDEHGYMPDVQFYRTGNLPVGQDKGLEHGHPDLVVEVISPTSRSKDTVRKLRDYAALGVPEYWLVDPEARTLERLVLREGIYGIVEALEGEAVFAPSGFDGLEVPLARLWEEGE